MAMIRLRDKAPRSLINPAHVWRVLRWADHIEVQYINGETDHVWYQELHVDAREYLLNEEPPL